MARVHPHAPISSSNKNMISNGRETFTLWMKSLIFHGNGCTVYNSNGEIVYRIDNYGKKSSNNEVNLMDVHGEAVFAIQKKNWVFFGRWEGYKLSDSNILNKNRKPFFRVTKRCCKFLKRNSTICEVNMGHDKSKTAYKIVGSLARKSSFKIIDTNGNLVAEVTQKQSSSGVVLGNDVLKLVVESQNDHSFIMALVTVYGLINHQM